MKNYVLLDLGDPDLSSKITTYASKHPDILKHWGTIATVGHHSWPEWQFCRPLVDAVNRVFSWSDLDWISTVITYPGVEIIHTDYDGIKMEHFKYYWALNIPVLNCDKTYYSFYEALPGEHWESKKTAEYPVDVVCHWKKEQLKEVDRVYFTQPMLFNTTTIHCAHNPTNQPRVAISVRMKCNLLEQYNLKKK